MRLNIRDTIRRSPTEAGYWICEQHGHATAQRAISSDYDLRVVKYGTVQEKHGESLRQRARIAFATIFDFFTNTRTV